MCDSIPVSLRHFGGEASIVMKTLACAICWFVAVVGADGAPGDAIFENVHDALRAFKRGFEDDSPDLTARSESYVRTRFTEALRSPVILEMRSVTLRQLLLKDWIVEEVEVLRALEGWFALKSDPGVRSRLKRTLYVDALNPAQLRSAIGSEVLGRRDVIDALIRKVTKQPLQLRFSNQLAGSDVVREIYLAEIVTGFRLNQTSTETFLGSQRICSHDVASEEGITLKLGAVFTLDTLAVKFAEDEDFAFAISVSLEGKDWERVVLPSEHKFARDFEVSFRPTRVQYIRLVGASGSLSSGQPSGIKVRAIGASYSRTRRPPAQYWFDMPAGDV